MESVIEETKNIMKKYNIKANKSLGQNFLINQEVINAIIDGANVSKDDLIIEIGPGLGTLTKYLIEKAEKVICIELDERMIRILKDRFGSKSNLEIINDDVLKVDLNTLIKEQKGNGSIKNVKIVANLPYYITSPIIMKLLEDKLDIQSITVMVQKEVADRLIAKPGERETGAITYTVYYYCCSDKIIEVPKDSFIPEPEVTSEVIKLNLRDKPEVDLTDTALLFQIIKSAFMQRRKTVLNSLTNANIFSNKEKGVEILNKVGININSRAEQLTLQDFANIAKNLEFYKN